MFFALCLPLWRRHSDNSVAVTVAVGSAVLPVECPYPPPPRSGLSLEVLARDG